MANIGELKRGAAALATELGESARHLDSESAAFESQKSKADAVLEGSDTAVEQEVSGKIAKASESAKLANQAVNKAIEALTAYADAR